MVLMNIKNKSYHNILGDNVKELYWLLFKHTGKIEYYLKYKNINKDDKNGSNSGEGI